MEPLADEIRICRKCGLWRQRKNAVPGEGSLDATVMLIGEAPGYWEDVKGRPFVGAAGKILDEMLSRAGICRSGVYVTNVVNCRTPENRDPLPSEIETCTHACMVGVFSAQPLTEHSWDLSTRFLC